MRLKCSAGKNDCDFMEKMREISGVEDVTLIQYNGEYHG